MKTFSKLFSLLCMLALLVVAGPASAKPRMSVGDFQWAAAMGNTGSDYASRIFVDGSGNVYTVGEFEGTVDFNPSIGGVDNLTSAGDVDVFISKLDNSGNLVWARNVGGTSADRPAGVAVDGSGNVYVIGGFEGTADFDPGAGVNNLISNGDVDVFILKLDSSGAIVWVTQIGNSGGESAANIALDGSGNIYFAGGFELTTDFDPGLGTSNLTSFGDYDAYAAKLNGSGELVWVKQYGGTGSDYVYDMSIDASGNTYLAGDFEGSGDFDPGAGITTLTSNGLFDIFVAKLDTNGNHVWAKSMGGTYYDTPYGIDVDADGNVYTSGSFGETADFNPGAATANLTSLGGLDIFVSKLSSNGTYAWAKGIGGTGSDRATAIMVNPDNSLLITGYYVGTVDFDPGAGASNMTADGILRDAFALRLSQNGIFAWAKSMGGNSDDQGSDLATDTTGNMYIAGYFYSAPADFDPGAATYNLSSAGNADAFVVKLSDGVVTTTLNSIGSQDGHVLESSENSNLGGSKKNKGGTIIIGDDASDRQYRGLLSFNMSIPASAEITSVILKVKSSGKVGSGDPVLKLGGFKVDIKGGNIGNKAGLQLADFKAAANMTLGTFKPTAFNGWYNLDLTDAKAIINKAGNTQIRIRFAKDDNNNNAANYLKLISGNSATNRPQLIVEYYVP